MKNFGDFSFDAKQKCLRKNGERVDLRPKSLSVLEHLLEKEGEIVSKSQLLERSWQDAIVTEDSLFQCIRELRSTLGESKDQKFIQTVPKQGYIWVYQAPIPAKSISKKWALLFLFIPGLLFFWPSQKTMHLPQENQSYTVLFLPATYGSKGLADWVPHGLPHYMAQRWDQMDYTNTLTLQDLGFPQRSLLNMQNSLAQKAHLGFLTGSDWVVEIELSHQNGLFRFEGALIGQDQSRHPLRSESPSLKEAIQKWEEQTFRFLRKRMGWQFPFPHLKSDENEIKTVCRIKQAMTFGRLKEAQKMIEQAEGMSLLKTEIFWKMGQLDKLPNKNGDRNTIEYWELLSRISHSKNQTSTYKKALFQYFKEAGIRGKTMDQAVALLRLTQQSLKESNLDLAQHHGFQALYFAERISSKILLVEANQLLGQVLFQQGFEQEAKQYFEHALEHAEKLQDQKDIAQLHFELGGVSHRLGASEEAISYYKKARDHFFLQGDLMAVESCQRLIQNTN